MPQIINIRASEEVTELVKKTVVEELPELSVENWAGELKKNGIDLSTLANIFSMAIQNAKPADQLKAIPNLLTTLGIGNKVEKDDRQVVIHVNGENIQLNTMLAPQRTVYK